MKDEENLYAPLSGPIMDTMDNLNNHMAMSAETKFIDGLSVPSPEQELDTAKRWRIWGNKPERPLFASNGTDFWRCRICGQEESYWLMDHRIARERVRNECINHMESEEHKQSVLLMALEQGGSKWL